MLEVSAFFDESGTQNDRLLVVAGAVADFVSWGDLCTDWEEILRDYELTKAFHMKEFWNGRSGIFRHLKKTRRYEMMERLSKLIRQYVQHTIILSVRYNRLLTPDIRSTHGTAYTFLVREALWHVHYWAWENHHEDPINYMWEDGHRNAVQAISKIHEIARAEEAETGDEKELYRIGSYGLGSKRDNPALQVADVLAHNYYRQRMA